jgi:FtsZ-interacting cell division protein ZipA
MLLVIGSLALMLMLPSAHLNAGPIDNPNGSPASSISNVNRTDLKGLNQTESTLLMAQATEEHRSSESSESSTRSTTEAPPPVQQEQHSSESSSSTMRSTTEAPPEHCVSNCREHYNQSLRECNEPNHPNHNKCDKWAREREQECLNTCK